MNFCQRWGSKPQTFVPNQIKWATNDIALTLLLDLGVAVCTTASTENVPLPCIGTVVQTSGSTLATLSKDLFSNGQNTSPNLKLWGWPNWCPCFLVLGGYEFFSVPLIPNNLSLSAGLELGIWNWGCHLLHRMSSAGAREPQNPRVPEVMFRISASARHPRHPC